MSDIKTGVIIPFRDRGLDLRRSANLEVVTGWWYAHGFEPQVVDDGLEGDVPFNRHRAYNRAVARFPETQVFVFTEADMLIHPSQINMGARLAARKPGLVVPFTRYRYLDDQMTAYVRNMYHDLMPGALAAWWETPPGSRGSVFDFHAASTMEDGKSIGAVNIVSRATLDITGGFTEATSGNWYDDNITEEGFAYLTGQRTQFVPGPAVHLYHLPGWKGDHLSKEDREATRQNKLILEQMRRWVRLDNRLGVKTLMATRDLTANREVQR